MKREYKETRDRTEEKIDQTEGNEIKSFDILTSIIVGKTNSNTLLTS